MYCLFRFHLLWQYMLRWGVVCGWAGSCYLFLSLHPALQFLPISTSLSDLFCFCFSSIWPSIMLCLGCLEQQAQVYTSHQYFFEALGISCVIWGLAYFRRYRWTVSPWKTVLFCYQPRTGYGTLAYWTIWLSSLNVLPTFGKRRRTQQIPLHDNQHCLMVFATKLETSWYISVHRGYSQLVCVGLGSQSRRHQRKGQQITDGMIAQYANVAKQHQVRWLERNSAVVLIWTIFYLHLYICIYLPYFATLRCSVACFSYGNWLNWVLLHMLSR